MDAPTSSPNQKLTNARAGNEPEPEGRFETRKHCRDFVRKLLSNDGEAGGEEAGVADGLNRPDDETECDESFRV